MDCEGSSSLCGVEVLDVKELEVRSKVLSSIVRRVHWAVGRGSSGKLRDSGLTHLTIQLPLGRHGEEEVGVHAPNLHLPLAHRAHLQDGCGGERGVVRGETGSDEVRKKG